MGCPRSSGSSARIATGGPGDAQWGRAEPAVAVGGSPSAPYNLGAGRQCSPARLCAVSWAGTAGRIASGARLRRPRGHRAGRGQSAVRCSLGGCSRSAFAQCSRASRPDELGRACGQVACPRAACLERSLHGAASGLDDPASGRVTWPAAVAPRIGRNAGRWLQSQSESGWRAHGPDVDHGRRAEPGRCPGPRSTGHACPSRASLAGLLGTCGPRPH